MTTETITIQTLAAETVKQFERRTRDDGSTYWSHKDAYRSGDWVQELCRDAHGDMLPDDYRYEYIVDALYAFADYDDDDHEMAIDEIEADPYTKDPLAWLSSHSYRMDYANEAIRDVGFSEVGGIMQAVIMGQIAEKREIYDSVLESLKSRLEALDDPDA